MKRAWVPSKGSVVADKFTIEAYLGKGGMGVVYVAAHATLGNVALKLLRPDRVLNEPAVSRFLLEARTGYSLKSAHAVRVLDAGRTEHGVAYIAMELLDGQDVSRLLVRDGPRDVMSAADYVIQACDALIEAHAQGIVHRDIKPSNLFLARRENRPPIIKVLDFGISKCREAVSSRVEETRTQRLVGSPPYMSPEQIAAPRSVDARSDIWSLGIVLYEMTHGYRPFRAETREALYAVIVHEPPAPPVRGLPRELGAVITRCLQKDPDARFTSVQQLATALLPLASAAGKRIAEDWIAPPPVSQRPSRRAGEGPAQLDASQGSIPAIAPGTDASRSATTADTKAVRWLLAATAAAIGLTPVVVSRLAIVPPPLNPEPPFVVVTPTLSPPAAAIAPPLATLVPSPSWPSASDATTLHKLHPVAPAHHDAGIVSPPPEPIATATATAHEQMAPPSTAGFDASLALAMRRGRQTCGGAAGPRTISATILVGSDGRARDVALEDGAVATPRGQCIQDMLREVHATKRGDFPASKRVTFTFDD